MDFQSAMETFAEAWVAANAGTQTQALALTRPRSQFSCPINSMSNNESSQNSNLPIISAAPYPRTDSPLPPISAAIHRKSITINNTINERINAKANCLNLALMGARDNLNSSGHNIVNCSQTTVTTPSSQAVNLKLNKGIAVATSPLLENGKGGGGGGGSIGGGSGGGSIGGCGAGSITHERSLTSQSPHDFRKDFEHNMENAKSLPLHCIVESTTSMQTAISLENRCPLKGQPNIETDSYVIMPIMTPFSELLNTALQLLGYSAETASTARGSIIIKNWKPLSTERITDNPLVSVGDILGELTSVVTLRILILRAKPSMFSEIKDKLLKLLILQSHPALRSSGCPLDEITLSHICRSSYQNSLLNSTEMTEEIYRNFEQWWGGQLTAQANNQNFPFINSQKSTEELTPEEFALLRSRSMVANREVIVNNHKLASAAQAHHPNFIIHPAMQSVHSQYPNQKTRMRTSFDPEMELPKLQRWFHENPHPSRQQIQSYVFQLNSLESRRGRKPLDVNNVVYWFKNARAAQKRAELRGGQGISNGFMGLGQSDRLDSHHAIYVKSPHSIKSEDCDNMSQHSDDLDDDLDRPPSPQLPLSLTTHERRPSPLSGDENQKKNQAVDSIHSSPLQFNNNCIENSNNCTLSDKDKSDDLNIIEPSPDSIIEKANSLVTENNHDSSSIKSPKNSSTKDSPQSDDDLDMEDPDLMPMEEFLSPSPPSFPMLPNSMFSHSIMYMSHYIPQMNQNAVNSGLMPNTSPLGLSTGLNLSRDERRKRNRTFIDPVTEVPKLEQWFSMNTHPSHNLILKYTEDLNRMPYRQKFPRLESKNVQFWFKNRRAKCKRLKMSLYDGPHVSSGLGPYQHTSDRE